MLANLLLLLKPEAAWKQGVVAQLLLWALYTRKVCLQNNNLLPIFECFRTFWKTSHNSQYWAQLYLYKDASSPMSYLYKWPWVDTHREKREQGMLHFSLSSCNHSASSCFQLKKFPEHAVFSHIRQYPVGPFFKNSSCKWIFCIYKHFCQCCTTCLLPVFILNLVSASLTK